MAGYKHNIENFIGAAKMPVGVAGPLRVNGLFAQGDYYVPLATTEQLSSLLTIAART
jgi:hydroxymethylglutaryl-CoA reductase (NADPH)